jgi:hypothetical protein
MFTITTITIRKKNLKISKYNNKVNGTSLSSTLFSCC